MYFVDRDILEKRLVYLEGFVSAFAEKETWESKIDKLALERIVHMTIETMMDIGTQTIDGFIMRDPGSYDDIVDIFVDEKVIEEKDGDSIKKVLTLRKVLVQEYFDIDHEEIARVYKSEWETLNRFSSQVRHYLNTELGPVSAFLPK